MGWAGRGYGGGTFVSISILKKVLVAMSQIARLKATQIANGNVINADDINAELNQLVDESNAQDGRVTGLESGNITLQGTKTFSTAPKMDELLENTTGNGILAEEVRLKQGSAVLSSVIRISGVELATNRVTTGIAHGLTSADAVRIQTDDTLPSPLSSSTTYYVNVASATELTLHTTTTDATAGVSALDITTSGVGNHALLADPPSVSNGQLWFNSAQQQLKVHLNNDTRSLLTTQFLADIMLGPAPEYVSASAVKLKAGLRALDSTNTQLIEVTSDITINLGSAGINGLDTGTETNDTWYYVYLIGDSTGTNSPAGLFSTVNEATTGEVTLPTGYDVKRQLPLAIRNNGSGDIIPFTCPQLGTVLYLETATHYAGTNVTGELNVLSSGTSSTYTGLSLSTYVPPIAQLAYMNFYGASGSVGLQVRPTGITSDYIQLRADASGTYTSQVWLPTSTSQSIDYKRTWGGGTGYLDVIGYQVTVAL